jgi:uncharacterized membrane protein YeaQ/YmgE (transglycosylase-associated protein family)
MSGWHGVKEPDFELRALGDRLAHEPEAAVSGEHLRVLKPRVPANGATCQDHSYHEGKQPVHIVWFLLVGLVAGWLAGKITKGSGFGVLGDIVIGVIGAFVGGFLFRLVGFSAGGTLGSIIVATIGAVVLVYIVRAIKSV